MASRTTALVGKLSISGKEARAEMEATKKKFDDLTRSLTKPVSLTLRKEFEALAKQTYPAVSRAQATFLNQQNAVIASSNKLGASSVRAGMGVLELSRAFEDAQFGMRGVLNNIPGIVQSFGGAAGIAGAASLAAVGLSIVATHMDFTGEAARKAAKDNHELAMSWQKQTDAADEAARQGAAVRQTQERLTIESENAAESHHRAAEAIDREAQARHADAAATSRQAAARKAMRESNMAIYGMGLFGEPGGGDTTARRNINRDAEKAAFRADQQGGMINEEADRKRAAEATKEAQEARQRANFLKTAAMDLLDSTQVEALKVGKQVSGEKLAEAAKLYDQYKPGAGSGKDEALSAFYAKLMTGFKAQMLEADKRLEMHSAAHRASGKNDPGQAGEEIRSLERLARDKEQEAISLKERAAASAKARGVEGDAFGTEQQAKDDEAIAQARHENALAIIKIVTEAGQRAISDLKEGAARILERSRQVLRNIHSDQDLSISEVKNPRRRRKLERARNLERRIREIQTERPGISGAEAAGIADREQEVRDRAAGDRTIRGAGPARKYEGLDDYDRFRDKTIPVHKDTPNEKRGKEAVNRAMEDVKRAGGAGGPGDNVISSLTDTLKALTEVLRNQGKTPAERNQPMRKG